ncbi:MAG: DUF3379 domain-containing protein [gamma proteobacterium symbiont of Bathyaustriella thionipta]|nr:DUF3379 domain-containing protein [gamma proteobacterium symbiont of Bathyaustriella thionipta]MCU7950080.1 DUF3379 domain-containing protein [gamma proteobacterium symbiont of Bathyaustriella thionipta]MCU7953930.1 DUF3379 domain-containing protein [gamma proteobacterium symbiont of Bathyaustriella thionipta]MCU7956665.1 DUF3379 domain-containing protein [gamma proteobacterium symbiont of Bathyaustriella thionipta]MCU7967873.1 DUF3379 domain-containing protein [gamma proteobacterium symbion
MDDLEFRKTATIDPDNQDPEFLKKKQQNQYNRHFTHEQQRFNQKLQDTLTIAAPENLTDRVILSQQLSQHKREHLKKRQKKWRNRFIRSVAASVIIAFSAYLLIPVTINSAQLAQDVITHVHEDTHALNVRMDVPKSSIDTMLASYGGKLEGPIGQVSFLGHCIVGGHTGIHLVLNTAQGLVTVILLPTQSINQPSSLADSQFNGVLYPSQKGSIAIIAEHTKSVEDTRQKINQNLHWII